MACGTCKAQQIIRAYGLLATNQKKELSDKRMKVCRECPGKYYRLGMCMRCKCVMKAKTRLEEAKCPEGYW